jgi:hypothetical protein
VTRVGKDACKEASKDALDVELGCSRVERRKSVIMCTSSEGFAFKES